MNILQKLKIKLFGKERWRVVGGCSPIHAGDLIVYTDGSGCEFVCNHSEWLFDCMINTKKQYVAYRKVN